MVELEGQIAVKNIIFVTGNAEKMIDATSVCGPYGITLRQQRVEIDEIQHHDPHKITEAKARDAFEVLREPLVVNDSSWEIPALGGFPGGYMKDVNEWFAPEDFLALMAGKRDKSIILHEVVAYFDGTTYQAFTSDRTGKFLTHASSEPGSPLASVVAMDCDDGKTINQVFALRRAGTYPAAADNYEHWKKFAQWLSKGEK